MDDIRRFAQEKCVDLVCIQEPYVRHGKPSGMPCTVPMIYEKDPKVVTVVFNKAITTVKPNLT
jgi:hypothetical protein